MGVSFVRTIILYAAVITAMRTMGKRTIGEMSPTELVVSIMISDLASVPMQSKSTPLADGLIPIFTLVFLELIFAFLSLKSTFAKRVLVGKSCHIVKRGQLLEGEMARLRISIDDLEEQIRQAGYLSLNDVSEVIIETNGKASIVPKEEVRPLALSDMGFKKVQSEIPSVVISDGKVNEKELKSLGLGREFIRSELKRHGIKDIGDVLYLSVQDKKTLLLQKKKE